ncbi:MAG: sigma-70 family RNA polymerase sigma factor [Actinobacteria bacterium]|nr:MAG: sigma-70 family RNA polymerase sigma factor [Actinomycetota bacterium]
MNRQEWLAEEFERQRPHLRSVAYRMLGSLTEAEDAVQESWVRLDRHDPGGPGDLRGWLTVVVGRICLDMLRSRRARREQYAGTWLPEPIVTPLGGSTARPLADPVAPDDPARDAELADSVGLALLVVLETLEPAERLAFVLHDVFAVPFEEIAPVVERSPVAARQLASRARRRIHASAPSPDADLRVQRRVVDAFLAAARNGDFDALLRVLDPGVVLRTDGGGVGPLARPPIEGAAAVARQLAAAGGRFAVFARPAIVNGAAGVIVDQPDAPPIVVGFTVVSGRIAAIDIVGDPSKLSGLSAAEALLGE